MRRPTVSVVITVDEARALLDAAGRGEPATDVERRAVADLAALVERARRSSRSGIVV
jgi:hypothetical protein